MRRRRGKEENEEEEEKEEEEEEELFNVVRSQDLGTLQKNRKSSHWKGRRRLLRCW